MSGEHTEIERRALAHLEGLLALEGPARETALAKLVAEDPALAGELRALLGASPATTEVFARAVGRAADNLASEREAEQRPRLLGEYRVLDLLGRGGMGEVYRGERADGQFEQQVAIKLLLRGMDSEEILRRFLRERQILAQLDHPGVARLLDGGIAPDGRPYFVLEEVQGVPITDYATRNRLPLAARLRLVLDVCDAVEAAHQRFVVHRDLKPSNILVTGEGRVKLLDFGIAKVLGEPGEPDLTRTQLRIMTPSYAAPEQILGQPATTATDVYSLGVVLYELLAGKRPHDRSTTSPAALLATLAKETIERPSAAAGDGVPFAKELAGDLDTVVLTALEPSLARRYATVGAFAQDLRNFLEGRPIAARPATWSYRSGKFLRRHKLAVASVTLGFAALLATLGISLWQGDRARRAAVRAERTQAFLVSLFRSGDPWEGGAEKLTVGEVLDAAAPKLESELAGEPEVRAALEDALAQVHKRLGRLDKAGELVGRAITERRRRLGADAPEVGWSLVTRAEIEYDRGQYEAALASLAEAEPLLPRAEEREADQLLRWTEVRGSALEQAGRYDEALAEVEHSLALFRRRFGESHPELGRLYAAEASLLANLSRLPEAEVAIRRAIDLRAKVLPPDHASLVSLRVQLGDVLTDLSRTREALPYFEQALASQRRLLDANHPELAQTLIRYAFGLSGLGRRAESNRLYLEALAIFEHLDHGDAGAVLRYLGYNMVADHRFAEAAEYFHRAHEKLAARFEADHPMVLGSRTTTSLALLRLGRLAEAERELTSLIADMERTLGPDHTRLAGPLAQLGEVYRLTGRAEEALALHRRQRELAVKVAGTAQHLGVASAEYLLAFDFIALPKPDLGAARQALTAACDLVRELNPGHERVTECLLVSALLALREGDRPRAEREAAEGLALARQRFAADSPMIADAEDIADRVRRNFTGGRIPPWGPADGARRR